MSKGIPLHANRVAWELAAGPIPKGLFVCHTCDNRACVRNDDEGTYEVNGISHPRRGHLWLGTNKDNTDDKVAKGRAPTGEQRSDAKLTENAVWDIRLRLEQGESLASIGRAYDVTYSAIKAIRDGRNWKYLK